MKRYKWYNFFCQNKGCVTYCQKGLRNIVSNGHDRNGARKLICTECRVSFNETKGTPFFREHLSKREIIRIAKQFVEKTSFRGVARATGHHLDTIRRLASNVAEHCEAVTEFLLHDVKLGVHEVDEFWNFVKKNKRKLPSNFSQTVKKAMRTHTSTLKEKQTYS